MIVELKAEISGATKDIELASQEVQLLEDELARKQNIRSSISQSNLDSTRRSLLNARKAYQNLVNAKNLMETREARLRSGIKLVEKQIEVVELNIQRTTIRAPASGVIVSESVEPGSMVRAGDVVAILEDTSKVEVECNLSPDQLGWLIQYSAFSADDFSAPYQLPQAAVVLYGKIGNYTATWQGVLSRIDGIGFDELTKTIPCRIEVSQPLADTPFGKRPLVRNMYVKAKLQIETDNSEVTRRFLAFPAVAVQPGNYVWVIRNGRLHKFDVTIVDQFSANTKSKHLESTHQHQKEQIDLESVKQSESVETEPLVAENENATRTTEQSAPTAESQGMESEESREFVIVLQENGLKPDDQIVVSPLAQPTVNGKVRIAETAHDNPGLLELKQSPDARIAPDDEAGERGSNTLNSSSENTNSDNPSSSNFAIDGRL